MPVNLTAIPYDHDLENVKQLHKEIYGQDDTGRIERAFADITEMFAGGRRGFQRCDTRYHDLQHTIQTITPLAQIMARWNRSGRTPPLPKDLFELGIIAALCHDVGYIKKTGDDLGTGAKYTFRHVQRSIDFTRSYLISLACDSNTIASIGNIIRCTDIHTALRETIFACEGEQAVGFSLGTADLLGQMAAENYIEKLPYLFEELSEGYQYEGIGNIRELGIMVFESPDHLIRHWHYFFDTVVWERLKEMGALFEFLTVDGHNPYLESIARNIRHAAEMAGQPPRAD